MKEISWHTLDMYTKKFHGMVFTRSCEAQLIADHYGIKVTPASATHSSPDVVGTNFYPSTILTGSINKTNVSISTICSLVI